MATNLNIEDDAGVAAQVRFLNLINQGALSAALRAALRAALLLGIPDILADAGTPLSCDAILHKITANPEDSQQQQQASHHGGGANGKLNAPGRPSVVHLSRILRALTTQGVFSAVLADRDDTQEWNASEDDRIRTEYLYGLTDVSRLMVSKNQNCMAAVVLSRLNPDVAVPCWNHLHRTVLTGLDACSLALGKDVWGFFQDHPAHAMLFSKSMQSTTVATLPAILPYYDGFKGMKGVITDVGGNSGASLRIILGKYPHLQGINFDLPYVIARAPQIDGVEHVSGDMFKAIPPSDAIFMKSILHDWDEEQCIQILRNCHRALPEDGKVILVESIMRRDGNKPQDTLAVTMDLGMLCLTQGLEREEWQWRRIFEKAGFTGVRITETGHFLQIIELSK